MRGRWQSAPPGSRKENMGNRRKTLTEIEIKHTLLMAKHDLAVRDIANILKRSTATVYKILKACGISARADERTEEQHESAASLLDIGTYYATYGDRRQPVVAMYHDGFPPPIEPEPESETVEPEPLELVEFVCKECGQEFHLTTDHIEWFEARGINVPKRCQPCRDRRREMHDGGGVIGPANLDELSALRRRLEDMERRAALWESTQSEIE